MRVLVREDQTRRLFYITGALEDTTVGDLVKRATSSLEKWERVWVDGKPSTLEDRFVDAALVDGTVVSNTPDFDEELTCDHVLVEVAGDEAGRTHLLEKNKTYRIGRSPESQISLASPLASWSHCFVIVNEKDGIWIQDDDSSNKTFVNGEAITPKTPVELPNGSLISIGGIVMRLEAFTFPAISDSTPIKINQANAIEYNRPPRKALPETPEAIEAPFRDNPEKPGRLSWITMLAPLLMAVAMVAIMGSFRYGLIALLSPVMYLGSWWDQKRRAKKSKIEVEEKFETDLNQFKSKVKESIAKHKCYLEKKTPSVEICFLDAVTLSPELWRCRPEHSDYLQVQAGYGTVDYEVPLTASSTGKLEDEVKELVDNTKSLCTPIGVDFTQGAVGIWGERESALAVARSLICQLATHNGPADMTLAVLAGEQSYKRWKWCNWLPHTRVGGSNPNNRWVGVNEKTSQLILRNLWAGIEQFTTPGLVLVIDELSLLEGRECPGRDLLSYNQKIPSSVHKRSRVVTGIVIAESAEELPASCVTVIEAKTKAELALAKPSESLHIADISSAGISEEYATDWSIKLARLDDPEMSEPGANLPSLVNLLKLLGLDTDVCGDDIASLWNSFKRFDTPIGVSEKCVYKLDLVSDGPHGLVGGTTGSGKSELLRSLVAGLAARVSPEKLTFILVDFKGGAAFASLDQLPHTIGTLSNLEAPLAYRAIRALEAEMDYRQHMFAEAGEGVDNIDAYLETKPEEPMPRILVVVDEFAQLAKEYPEVLSSLVSIGAVGRTLGVHMILATQRPAGVVNDDILANTNMRTALRVQSRDDSVNVIGVPGAASIGRDQRGRAYIKLGEEDITPIQTALVTGYSNSEEQDQLIVTQIHEVEEVPAPPEKKRAAEASDMDLLIEAIKQANKKCGYKPPRRVWPEPLGEEVILGGFEADSDLPADCQLVEATGQDPIKVVLCDNPDKQSQFPFGWELAEGNLLLAGVPGSGTSSTLLSLALSAANNYPPEDLEIMVVDFGNRVLEPLSKLKHVIGYAGAGAVNRELQARSLRYMINQMELRSATPGKYPKLMVLIDGLETLKEDFSDYDSASLLEAFYQVWAKGPNVGIHCAVATSRIKSVPPVVWDVTKQKWLFSFADVYDYSYAGIGKDNVPKQTPGRCVLANNGLHAHVALPENGSATAVDSLNSKYADYQQRTLIAKLPTCVSLKDVSMRTSFFESPARIPIGIRESDLGSVALEVYPGEHILISGPARSGKSSLLLTMAKKIITDSRDAGLSLGVVGIASMRSPLLKSEFDIFPNTEVPLFIEAIRNLDMPTLVLVDDANMVEDVDKTLHSLFSTQDARILGIVSGRNDDLRSQYGHWTNAVRKSRVGVLLQPNLDFDGELLGVKLPRSKTIKIGVGRGYACQNGQCELVQTMTTIEGCDS